MIATMNDDLFDLQRDEWRAIDAELPIDLRPEVIAKESDPQKREQLVMRLQIEQRRIKARRDRTRRPRAIGPVDRAMRRVQEHYRDSRQS